MIDARTAPAAYDDTVLIAHVASDASAILFTARDDDDAPVTYALVARPAHDIVLESDDDDAPDVVYYADAATSMFTSCTSANVTRASLLAR